MVLIRKCNDKKRLEKQPPYHNRDCRHFKMNFPGELGTYNLRGCL